MIIEEQDTESNYVHAGLLSILKYIKVDMIDGEYIVKLVDEQGSVVLKGYGDNPIAAMNDLHSNLI